MVLIIISLIMGFVGIVIGGVCGGDLFAGLFGIVGVLSPGLVVLQQIYDEVKKKSN